MTTSKFSERKFFPATVEDFLENHTFVFFPFVEPYHRDRFHCGFRVFNPPCPVAGSRFVVQEEGEEEMKDEGQKGSAGG